MKNILPKFACLILFVCLVITGCSSVGLNKYSKNLNEYTIKIDFDDESKTLNCEEKVHYINNTETTLQHIDFHLYPNAFKRQESDEKPVSDYNFNRAYPNGFDSGYINIEEVKIKNSSVEFLYVNDNETILQINLKDKLYPTQNIELVISFKVKIPNANHRFGYGENTINVGNFYPIVCVYGTNGFVHDGYHYNGDPFYSEMSNYNVEINYNSKYILASTGECLTETKENGKTVSKINARVVRDFAFVLSDKFNTHNEVYKNTKIYYMYYNDKTPEKTIKLIKDALITFTNLIGPYPYSTLYVVQSNFLHGGMEYPNIVLISDEIEETLDYYNVIVHELAHQWFYNIIGNDEVNEAWLDEGLTEYVTLMFFELNDYGVTYDDLFSQMLSSYLMFVDVYKDVFKEIDTSISRSLNEFNSEYEYTYMVYVKSVLMLDNLREVMGDANFCLGLKTYYENNKFKIATKEHFIRDFGKASPVEIKNLINSWLDGKVEITR